MKIEPKLYYKITPYPLGGEYELHFQLLSQFNPDGDELGDVVTITEKNLNQQLGDYSKDDALFVFNKDEFITLSDHTARLRSSLKKYQKEGRDSEYYVTEEYVKKLEYRRHKYIDWFLNEGYSVPASLKYREKTKTEHYFEEFARFWNDDNSTPSEVKKVLNDKMRWANPSAYLKKAKEKFDITTKKLKTHPGFSWVDPKGTAKD